MPYYLAQYLGAGTPTDPFRPVGSDQPGWSAIDLRPDGGATLDGGGLNACFLHLPIANPDPSLVLVALDATDSIGAQLKQAIVTRLNLVSPPTATRFKDLVLDLMLGPPPNGWRFLRPTVSGLYEVWLNGMMAAFRPQSVGAGFNETWPTNKNPLDSPSTGEDQIWTTELSTFQVTGNHLEATAALATARARCGTALTTDNQKHTANYVVTTDGTTTGGIARVMTRKSSVADTCYYLELERSKFAIDTILSKRVTGTTTTLATDTGDPGTPGTMYCRADGSTISGQGGTGLTLQATDTAITGNTLVGVEMIFIINSPEAQLDTHFFEDIGSGTVLILRR